MIWWSAWKNDSRSTICTTCPTISLSSIIDASRHISASMACGGSLSKCLVTDESMSWLIPRPPFRSRKSNRYPRSNHAFAEGARSCSDSFEQTYQQRTSLRWTIPSDGLDQVGEVVGPRTRLVGRLERSPPRVGGELS